MAVHVSPSRCAELVARAVRICNDADVMGTQGHCSMRDPDDANVIWINNRHSSRSTVRADEIVPYDIAAGKRVGEEIEPAERALDPPRDLPALPQGARRRPLAPGEDPRALVRRTRPAHADHERDVHPRSRCAGVRFTGAHQHRGAQQSDGRCDGDRADRRPASARDRHRRPFARGSRHADGVRREERRRTSACDRQPARRARSSRAQERAGLRRRGKAATAATGSRSSGPS